MPISDDGAFLKDLMRGEFKSYERGWAAETISSGAWSKLETRIP